MRENVGQRQKVLNATFAVSNNQFAVSKNMNRGSVRGLVLKSTPTQPKESTYEGMAWNDSVEAALDQGMESISAENHFLSDPPPYLLSHPVISTALVTA